MTLGWIVDKTLCDRQTSIGPTACSLWSIQWDSCTFELLDPELFLGGIPLDRL